MRIIPAQIENSEQASRLMFSLRVSREGINIMSPKIPRLVFEIEGIKSWEANIIKQYSLSLGTDAAIEREALVKKIKTSILVFGSIDQIKKLCGKIDGQSCGLSEVSRRLLFCLKAYSGEKIIFTAGGRKLRLEKPIVCGIINLTPDSFSGDGLLGAGGGTGKDAVINLALKKAEAMLKEGAKMIDVGGESSRPGSLPVDEREERKRVIPVLRALRKEFKKAFISVDTYKYNVAKSAAEEGADVINDITALRACPKIASLVKKYKLGCILMHMKGKPQNMQKNPRYRDVLKEELDFFEERVKFCSEAGITREYLCVDPGIGFGKRLADNLRLINELYKLKIMAVPILVGVSRKSFIGEILGAAPDERGTGTIAAAVAALLKGADILRVHDVKNTVQAVKVASGIAHN